MSVLSHPRHHSYCDLSKLTSDREFPSSEVSAFDNVDNKKAPNDDEEAPIDTPKSRKRKFMNEKTSTPSKKRETSSTIKLTDKSDPPIVAEFPRAVIYSETQWLVSSRRESGSRCRLACIPSVSVRLGPSRFVSDWTTWRRNEYEASWGLVPVCEVVSQNHLENN